MAMRDSDREDETRVETKGKGGCDQRYGRGGNRGTGERGNGGTGAHRRVDRVSSDWSAAGLMAATMTVTLLPPKLSFSSHVSTLLR